MTASQRALDGAVSNDWSKHLDTFIDGLKVDIEGEDDGGYRESTPKKYRQWLTGWVEYLKTQGNVPTTQNIKQYLELKYKSNPKTYNRIGRQIVCFTN